MRRKKPAPQKPDLEKAIKALGESIASAHDRLDRLERVLAENKPSRTWFQWLAGGSSNEL